MRIAVTGRQGQVARALIERGGAAGVKVLPLARPDIDLARPETIPAALSALNVDLVINAAAFTAVDLAEAQSERAFAINHRGAEAVAAAAASLKIPVVQLSTDYVFDGTLDRPYVESDPVNPINAYGRSKLAGELAVAATQLDHVILRTAWVYSPFGKNFVRTMLSTAEQRSEVSVVADQLGAPTNALDIADGILVVARRLLERPAASELRGIFNMTGVGQATWADFAEAIFAASQAVGGPFAKVNRIATCAYPTPARRPANSCLDGAKLAAIYGLRLPPWRQSLPGPVSRLLREGGSHEDIHFSLPEARQT
jgi:dTDP-4-dehydrorhamnose reductase